MADEDDDKSSKTELPSERKLQKLREQGNVPKSKEVNNFFMMLAMLIAVAFAMPYTMNKVMSLTGGALNEAGTLDIADASAIGNYLQFMAAEGLKGLAPIFVIFIVFALFGAMVQTGVLFSSEPIKPKLSKISIIKGFERLFNIKSLAEFLKSVFKMVVIGAVIYFILRFHDGALLTLDEKSVSDTVSTTHVVVIRIIIGVMIIAAAIAAVDFLFQKSRFTEEQKMSLRELKDEVKETEGDPFLKARQRQIRMERARSRMMQAVPKSDVVITNPTHFAVALSYKPEEGMLAPKVVAKGADHMAMKIRELATEHGVPLYEDPPLARQLYKDAEIDEDIPLDLYQATAQVIAFVFNLKKKKKK